jgi:Fe-Mn family superoxide dismutase
MGTQLTLQALEPVISKQIMELHHQKHHQTYINNLNGALSAQVSATQTNDVPTLISLQQKIKFNGGGHINHSLFWKNLTPPGTPGNELASAAPSLREAINSRWGSQDAFVKAFNAELLGIQGSGWGWLVSKGGPKGRLDITTTKDQDPVASGDVPIFGVDMWEHAYYLQVSRLEFCSGLDLILIPPSTSTTRPAMSTASGRSSTGPRPRSATRPVLRTR